MDRTWTRTLGRLVVDGARAVAAGALRSGSRPAARRTAGPAPRSGPSAAPRPATGEQDGGDQDGPVGSYPGDFTGVATVEYAPRADGRADPGEVVWGWVPYEEDHARGKDRPALVVGRDGRWMLALMLTSRDHDADRQHEGRGDDWMDVGSGAWDSRGRPSEVRLDRVLRLDPDDIRREGARLDRGVFDRVAAALRQRHGWG